MARSPMVRRIMICSQCNFQERLNSDCVCCQTVGTPKARAGGSGLDLNWTFSRQPVPWALRLVVEELLLFQLLILVLQAVIHSQLTTSPAALDKTGCSLLPATPIRLSFLGVCCPCHSFVYHHLSRCHLRAIVPRNPLSILEH